MHDALRADHAAAKSCPNRLVSEANTQNRNFPRYFADEIDRNPGFIRSAGTGRNHNFPRGQLLDLLRCDLIIPAYLDLFAGFADVLDEVKSKGIVIVENENHGNPVRLVSTLA